MPVSEEFRKEHAYWVRRRDQWRKEYRAIRDEIKYYREEMNYHNRENTYWLANRSMALDTFRQVTDILENNDHLKGFVKQIRTESAGEVQLTDEGRSEDGRSRLIPCIR